MAVCLGFLAKLPTSAQSLPAPPGSYAFRRYGPEQGLTNLSVNALAQDARGFLWVGTEDGLFRLEGSRMRRFGLEDGLPDSYIESSGLGATADGSLWVVTRKGAVLWKGERFQLPSALGISGWDGKAGIALAAGALILNDGSHRRSLLNGNGSVQSLDGLARTPGMRGAWMSADGRELLVLLAGRVFRRLDGVWSSRDLAAALKGNLLSILKDRQGRIWIRSERSLVRLAAFEGAFEDLSGRVELSAVNAGGALVEDALGRVWTSTAGSLAWFGEQDAGLLSEANGLPQGGANLLLVDRENSLWIGGEGLHRQLGRFAWEGYTRRQGLPAHVVWSLCRGSDGLLWAGTASGLAVGDAHGWATLPATTQRQFMALAEDTSGALWAAPSIASSELPWLLRRIPGTRLGERIPLPGLKAGTSATALAPGPDGSLWVGTDSAGLQHLRKQGSRWILQQEPVPGWTKDGIGVSSLYVPGQGKLWAASSHGIACFDGHSWRVMGKATGLPDEDLLAVVGRPDGEVWVAYRTAKMLSRVRSEGDALRVVETLRAPHPLLGHPISSLGVDASGTLWLGTSLGVLRWDGQRMERLGKAWGLPGEDCAQNAIWLDPNGDAWFGLSVGVAHFRVERHRIPDALPGILIQRAMDGGGSQFRPAGKPLEIPWGRRTVTFEYLPNSYAQGDSPTFQVRLLGLEDEWRETPLPEARYPNLPAGTYRFEVRLKDPLGATGPATGADFIIATPWWQTWMFRLAAFGLLLSAGYLGFRGRTELLRRRNEELEHMVRSRTEDLALANHALEEMSMGDPLTHLRNRRFISVTMPEEVARILRMFQNHLGRGETPLGQDEDMLLLMVDLDRFKTVNDAHGHRAGDEVLRQTGDLLREVCRESDTLVRWGGEEFLILAKRSNRENGDVIARNIVEGMEKREFHLPDGQIMHCTCSVGYSAFPVLPAEPEAFRWEEAVEIADQCLYAAKNSGRNSWVGAYCDTLRGSTGLKPGLLTDLQAFVATGDFQLRTSLKDPARLKWKDFSI
jgi:diguanylate cyclase (GGDEF)-like protein